MQADHQRQLRPGTEYARHFNLRGLERTDPIVMQAGTTFDTLREMDKVIRQYQADTAGVAPTLRGGSLRETCRKVWEFCYSHFQYRLDKEGIEQLRRPLRAWKERTSGIDCDCYSILISTILLNLGIAHKLRKTKYNGRADYQHIYVVVPIPGSSRYYTIDPVVDEFDKEVPFSAKYDFMMPIQVLNGVDASDSAPVSVRDAVRKAVPLAGPIRGDIGSVFGMEAFRLQQMLQAGGSGLGRVESSTVENSQFDATTVSEVAALFDATPEEARKHMADVVVVSNELLGTVRLHLENTRRDIRAKKEISLYDLAGAIDAVLAIWDDAPRRDALIAHYGRNSTVSFTDVAIAAPSEAVGLGGLFDSIGDFFGTVGGAIGQAAGWVGNQVGTAAQAVGQAGAWVGNGVANGATAAWNGVTQAASWVGNGVASGASAAWTGIKNASKWVAAQAVKIHKLIMKYNPLSILIRLGLRVAMRVNLFWMAERLALGTLTAAQAQAKGLNIPEWTKAKDRYDSTLAMWDALQGDESAWREAVVAGYNHSSGKSVSLDGLGEPATATATAAASGFIATIISWLSSVDWKKVLGTAQAVAGTVNTIVSKYAKTPRVGESYQTPLTEEEYRKNQQKYDNPPQGVPPVAWAALAAGGIYLLTSNS